MAPIVRPPPASDPVRTLDLGRPVMAQAVLRGPLAGRAWSAAIKHALIRHYGSLKAAAFALGQIDPSQLSRDLDDGKFKLERLDCCDETAQAAISAIVADALAARDPKARVRWLIRESRRLLDELAEAVA
jgi:hypothetical protein